MKEKKPCGEYHPLPCGLDRACPIPGEYHDVDKTDTEISREYYENE